MELHQYWNIVRRRWWLPTAITAVAFIASTVFALIGASAFQTTMRLAVSTVPTVNANDAQYDPVYYSNLDSEYLADDLSEFLTSDAFAQVVSQDLHQTVAPSTISDVTRAKKTHRFIDVTLTTSTREQGQAIAKSIGDIMSDPTRMAPYMQALNAYKSSITVVTQPQTTRGSSTLGLISSIGLRTIIGLILGLTLAFLIDYLDQSVRDRDEAERLLGIPVVAEIPRGKQLRAA